MTNISQIMKQAKAMQEKMAEVQKKVEEAEVQGSSGGKAVVVTVNAVSYTHLTLPTILLV